jgi:hypothetical protein
MVTHCEYYIYDFYYWVCLSFLGEKDLKSASFSVAGLEGQGTQSTPLSGKNVENNVRPFYVFICFPSFVNPKT